MNDAVTNFDLISKDFELTATMTGLLADKVKAVVDSFCFLVDAGDRVKAVVDSLCIPVDAFDKA